MWRRRDGRRSRGKMRRTVSQRKRCAHQPTDRPVRLPTLAQEGSEAASRAVKGAAAVGVGVCVVQVGRETSSGIVRTGVAGVGHSERGEEHGELHHLISRETPSME